MQKGRPILDLIDQVVQDTASARDFLAVESTLQTVAVETEDQDILMKIGRETMTMRPLAHRHLATKLSIPWQYYERMKSHAPGLLSVNANHWLAEGTDRRLLRTVGGQVRAILSDRYRPLDNIDLVRKVLPILQELGCVVESAQITEERLYVQASLPTLESAVRIGDLVRAGIIISNSEVESGSVSIKPMILRLACLNGMITDHGGIRRAHVGRRTGNGDGNGHDDVPEEWLRDETRKVEDEAFWMKVCDSVRGSLSEAGFESNVDALRAAADRKITGDLTGIVEVTSKRFGLTEEEKAAALLNLVAGMDATQYGLANAVTALANKEEVDYDRGVHMERWGAEVAGWSDEEWNSLFKN